MLNITYIIIDDIKYNLLWYSWLKDKIIQYVENNITIYNNINNFANIKTVDNPVVDFGIAKIHYRVFGISGMTYWPCCIPDVSKLLNQYV